MHLFSCSVCIILCFFFKQKTAYEMRISDWSSDVCSSDLADRGLPFQPAAHVQARGLELDGGDVAQAQPVLVDHHVAQLLQVDDLAYRLHPQAPAAVLDLARRDGKVQRLQALGQFIETETRKRVM